MSEFLDNIIISGKIIESCCEMVVEFFSEVSNNRKLRPVQRKGGNKMNRI